MSAETRGELFREEQRFTQVWIWLIVVAIAGFAWASARINRPMLVQRWFERFERRLERRLERRVAPTLAPGEHFFGGAGFTNRGASADESGDSSLAASSLRTASELDEYLGARVALVTTDQRLIFYSLEVGLLRVVPKEALIECPVSAIRAADERRDGQAKILELTFADGTTLELEGPRHANWSGLLQFDRTISRSGQAQTDDR